jgi:hypothetical protein
MRCPTGRVQGVTDEQLAAVRRYRSAEVVKMLDNVGLLVGRHRRAEAGATDLPLG